MKPHLSTIPYRPVIDPNLRQAMGPGYQVTLVNEGILRLISAARPARRVA